MTEVHFWLVLTGLIVMSLGLLFDKVSSVVALFGMMMIFLIGGVITPEQAFSGFSNQGVLTIAFLYVIAKGIQSTGLLDQLGGMFLGKPNASYRIRLLRLMVPTAAISGFMNNTPIVSLFVPLIKSGCRKLHLSPSRFLIPLSYATIFGGTWTLIGTSTTLVIHGFLIDAGYEGFRFFEPGKIGVFYTIIGLGYVILVSKRLLPDHKDVIESLNDSTREFVVALKVQPSFEHIGSTVEQAGLRHLPGLFLFQIERKGEFISPIGPDDKLEIGDRLFFTGLPSTIVELQRVVGLELMEDTSFTLSQLDSSKQKIYEAVISNGSRLVGQKVKDSNFRNHFDAVIIAIHRHGARIEEKIGNIILQEGDTLLILASHSFAKKWYHSREFLLVSESKQIDARPFKQSLLIFASVALMILSVLLGIFPMVIAAALTATIFVILKWVNYDEVIKAIDWKVLLVIASAFGISKAVEQSGVAELITSSLLYVSSDLGIFAIMLLFMFTAVLYTELITNTAAAALLFPVMLQLHELTSIPIQALALVLLFGATSSFATPIGYQTNLMVFGPGNYAYRDFLRIGVPLDLLLVVSATTLIYFFTF